MYVICFRSLLFEEIVISISQLLFHSLPFGTFHDKFNVLGQKFGMSSACPVQERAYSA